MLNLLICLDMDRPHAKSPSMTKIILILGDQLSHDIAALRRAEHGDVILMVEVMEEATYVKHHKKKIAFIFSAMRHFAEELRTRGHAVDYVTLDDPANTGHFTGEIARAITRHNAKYVVTTEAAEWRVQQMMKAWKTALDAPLEILPDDRFLCTPAEFARWAAGRKQLRMEYFYREMRRKTGLLMQGDAPEGGKWNFDAENRKPAKADLFMPRPPRTSPDAITQDVIDLVQDRFADHFGTLTPFWFAVDSAGAQGALEAFIDHALPRFGDYQDAMLRDERFLYHSVLSQYINVGLLDPLAVCRRVERAYHEGHAPLNAAEGFIRQIIGWREYVRGIYWLKMPDYVGMNELGATRPLPEFYWTGETEMACLNAAVTQTREEAYAHHIQRLMITGTFALLIGANPKEVHEWYLAVYADAFEWVELPNTLGMSQFADGGLLGSKPYAASGAYIDRMSDYCGQCAYNVRQKTGKRACPFNSLYWDFIARNEDKLKGNPRLGPVYRTWQRMNDETRTAHRAGAAAFLETL